MIENDGTRSPAAGTSPTTRRSRAWRAAVATALVAKVAAVGAWYASGLSTFFGPARAEATASEPKTPERGGAGVEQSARATAPGAKPPDVRALIDAITRRQAELDARERELAAREERLKLFEQDVTAKVASLEEIEKRLQVRSKSASAALDAAGESLAKVYGAMKPGEAAPLLERLDEATVLTIFTKMKEKQIGEILPLMSKEKAITLTQALASSAGR